MSKEHDDAWRELAIDTVRRLGSLVERAEVLLRQAEVELNALQARDEEKD